MLLKLWRWDVVGVVVSLLLGGGISMTTTFSHPWIADAFYLVGFGVLFARFVTWEETRTGRRKKFLAWSMFIAIILTGGTIAGNHYLNAPTRPIESTARVLVTEVDPIINEGKRPYFNIFFRNIGLGAAIGMVHNFSVTATDKVVEKVELDSIFARMLQPYEAKTSDEVESNDLRPQYFSYPGDAIPQPFWKRILGGELRLYVFTVLQYSENGLEADKVKVTESCIYFPDGNFTRFFVCESHNRIYTTCRDHKCT